MDFSIGDFAESLMSGGRVGDSRPTSPVSPPSFSQEQDFINVQSPDISNVNVPSTFISNLVTENVSEDKEVEREEPLQEEPITTSQDPILLEIRDLLLSLQNQINEMTSVGSIGVNLAGCSDPKKAKKEEEEEEEEETTEDKIKRILRQRAKR